MRTAAGTFLILLFIPLLLVGVITATVKFQLLAPGFWLNTFEENNVYEKLAATVKESSTQKLVEKGSSRKDATILTGLITKDNVKDIVSKNIVNFLTFANGKSQELDVYIPVDLLPRDLLPTNYGGKPSTIPAEQLLRSLNIQAITADQLAILSQVGFWVGAIFIADAALILFLVLFFYLLTTKGQHFWNLGAAMLVGGLMLSAAGIFGEIIRGSMISDWPAGSEPSQLILSTFLPFILQKILVFWFVIACFLVSFGIMLFFLKKRL